MKNIPRFLIEDKRCDSLPLVVLNNINTDDEIPFTAVKNNLRIEKKVETYDTDPFVPNAPFLYPLKTSENLTVFCFQGVEKGCIRNEWVNSNHNIADPVDFRKGVIVDVNGEKNIVSTFFERIDNSNIESNENPLDACSCSANETV